MAFGFLKKIVKTAGKGIGGAVHITASVAMAPTKLAGKVVKKIPVVGKPLSSVINLSNAPLRLADSIAQGDRLDKAVIANLKSQVKDVKTVAPYAQMVISIVPGVGTVAAGAIGAGVALADGQPIDKILVAGVKGALPGGPMTAAAFDASQAILSGKSITQIGIAAIPGMNDVQKKALSSTLQFAKDVAAGKKITTAAMTAAQNQLPPDVRKAVAIGLAIAQGKNVQRLMVQNVTPAVLNKLSDEGGKLIAANPVSKAGFSMIKNSEEQKGFKVATTILRYELTPMQVIAIRNKLSGPQKKGFDLASSNHIGQAETVSGASGIKPPVRPPANVVLTPAQKAAAQKNLENAAKAQFAFNATHGMVGATPALKNVVLDVTMSDANAKMGVTTAVSQIVATKPKGWWHRLLVKLRLVHEAPSVPLLPAPKA
jgi:hypothetical protein